MTTNFSLWPIPPRGEAGNNTDVTYDDKMPENQVDLVKVDGQNNVITFSKGFDEFDIKVVSKYETNNWTSNTPLRCIDECTITPKNDTEIVRLGRIVKATQLVDKKWKMTNGSNDSDQWKEYSPTQEQQQENILELEEWIQSNKAEKRGDMSRSTNMKHLNNGDIQVVDKPGSAFSFPENYFPFLRSYDFWYIIEYRKSGEQITKKIALGYSFERNFQAAPWV